ncbi:hypothetical protein F2Q69_00020234 [Brassica cretica]|uniref:Uncharacterized protein n=1 Tax=Brassica cretica TaxID=69181 RepID=A0A8S9QG20_BRACR|nr:hypothetical protein F2Q69_00020234 [Brassica cretica]
MFWLGSPARFIVSAVGGFRSSVLASGFSRSGPRPAVTARERGCKAPPFRSVGLAVQAIDLDRSVPVSSELCLRFGSSEALILLHPAKCSPLLLSLSRGFVELPSVLDVSSRQGVRPPFESRSCVSLKETRVLVWAYSSGCSSHCSMSSCIYAHYVLKSSVISVTLVVSGIRPDWHSSVLDASGSS